MRNLIKKKKRAKIDYISIVDREDLEEVKDTKGVVLAALAVRIGKTRLIDNIRIG